MSGSEDEIAAWDAAAEAVGTNRTAWLRGLANEAARPELAWKAARRADVIAIADALHEEKPAKQPTAAELETRLAKRSGFTGWRVKFEGLEFVAHPPPMPKGWRP